MNNTLRYLALALLVSVNLNAASPVLEVTETPVLKVTENNQAPEVKTPVAPEENTTEKNTPVVEEDDSSDSKGGFVSGIIAKTSEVASSGVAGVETFVTTYPKAIAGTATVATVVAVYALIKWKKSADKVAELEDELEEVNALTT